MGGGSSVCGVAVGMPSEDLPAAPAPLARCSSWHLLLGVRVVLTVATGPSPAPGTEKVPDGGQVRTTVILSTRDVLTSP